MSRLDFQNGFALGLASGGIVESGDNSRLNALESYIDDSKVIVASEDDLADKVKTLIFYTEVFRQYYENRKEEITVFPLIDWTKRTTAINLFDGFVNLETIMGEIDCSTITNVSSFVNALEKIKSLTFKNTKNVKNWRNAFRGCSSLETLGELDFSSCEDNYQVLYNCDKLINLQIAKESIKDTIQILSPVLSDESIQSIIDGLAPLANTKTLMLHTDVKAKLTDKQLTAITNKKWSVA